MLNVRAIGGFTSAIALTCVCSVSGSVNYFIATIATSNQPSYASCQTACAAASSGGKLISCIANVQEWNALFAGNNPIVPATRPVWLGLRQSPTGAEPSGGWSWDSCSTSSSYIAWHTGEPNQHGGVDEDCAVLAQGHCGILNSIIDIPCSAPSCNAPTCPHGCFYAPRDCLCETTGTAPSSSQAPSFAAMNVATCATCVTNPFFNYFIKTIAPGNPTSYASCQTACAAAASGGTLISCVANAAEWNGLFFGTNPIVPATRPVWIGLRQSPTGTEPGGGWSWDNCSTSSSYIAWNTATGEPNQHGGRDEDCGVIAQGHPGVSNKIVDTLCSDSCCSGSACTNGCSYAPRDCLCQTTGTAPASSVQAGGGICTTCAQVTGAGTGPFQHPMMMLAYLAWLAPTFM